MVNKNTKEEMLTKVINGVDKGNQGLSVTSSVLGRIVMVRRCLKNSLYNMIFNIYLWRSGEAIPNPKDTHGPSVKAGPTTGHVRSKVKMDTGELSEATRGKKGPSKWGSFLKK